MKSKENATFGCLNDFRDGAPPRAPGGEVFFFQRTNEGASSISVEMGFEF